MVSNFIKELYYTIHPFCIMIGKNRDASEEASLFFVA